MYEGLTVEILMQFDMREKMEWNLDESAVELSFSKDKDTVNFLMGDHYLQEVENMINSAAKVWVGISVRRSWDYKEILNKSLHAELKSINLRGGAFWLTLEESNAKL